MDDVSANITLFLDVCAEEFCEKWMASQLTPVCYRLMGREILQTMEDVSATSVLFIDLWAEEFCEKWRMSQQHSDFL